MKKVLVVDDDKAVRSAFIHSLEDIECEVIVAKSGMEALNILGKQEVNLIITDFKMPKMTGLELLTKIRTLGITTPVRVLTAFAEEFFNELEKAIDEGLNFELIRKPLERDEIREIICSDLDIETPTTINTSIKKHVHYQLILYIIGETEGSQLAIDSIKNLCETQFHEHYTLKVHNIFKEPILANEDRIMATPTLVKKIPAPIRKVIGDLTDKEKVLLGLDLKPVTKNSS